jgi:pyrroloquinoline quinone biosynthesis protein B
VLFNASPDIRAQLESFPTLQPGRAIRDTALRAIVLVDAQIDHTTGLLLLREHTAPWDVYCTRAVHDDLTTGYPIFNILGHFRGVNWHEVLTDESSFEIPGIPGLVFTAVPLKSEAPPLLSPSSQHGTRGQHRGKGREYPNRQEPLLCTRTRFHGITYPALYEAGRLPAG